MPLLLPFATLLSVGAERGVTALGNYRMVDASGEITLPPDFLGTSVAGVTRPLPPQFFNPFQRDPYVFGSRRSIFLPMLIVV